MRNNNISPEAGLLERHFSIEDNSGGKKNTKLAEPTNISLSNGGEGCPKPRGTDYMPWWHGLAQPRSRCPVTELSDTGVRTTDRLTSPLGKSTADLEGA